VRAIKGRSKSLDEGCAWGGASRSPKHAHDANGALVGHATTSISISRFAGFAVVTNE
jgi:hypothetical protein